WPGGFGIAQGWTTMAGLTGPVCLGMRICCKVLLFRIRDMALTRQTPMKSSSYVGRNLTTNC
ncbi:MAG TPA: hypothetical protein VN627_13115, partial [Novosphingobium sp.]|nr:hypothetical protein [Novosphingobium sp.]